MELEELIRRGGGVVSLRAMSAAGIERDEARRLIRGAGLERVRPGWYRAEGAHPDVVRAVAAGGALSCVNALVLRGAWSPPPLAARSAASGVHTRFASSHSVTPGVIAHIAPGPRVPVLSALDEASIAVTCLGRCELGDAAVAVLDSVLRRGILSPAEVAASLRAAGEHGRRLALRVDPSAESGTESLLRMLLRRAGVRFRTQMRIWGVGRVDFLIGDRLIVEADGIEFHKGEQVQRDRNRDNALQRLGFHVLRFTYWDVVERPEQVLATIRAVMARREQLWTRRNRAWAAAGMPDPVLGQEVPAVVETWAVCRERFQNDAYVIRNQHGASAITDPKKREGEGRPAA
ncbi:hypothetical protein USB125703_01141 [Pseudoclavibacter triregionum]|nr:hypothetical protein USB125703_01141 [Pseudoclavibacter triregionum]